MHPECAELELDRDPRRHPGRCRNRKNHVQIKLVEHNDRRLSRQYRQCGLEGLLRALHLGHQRNTIEPLVSLGWQHLATYDLQPGAVENVTHFLLRSAAGLVGVLLAVIGILFDKATRRLQQTVHVGALSFETDQAAVTRVSDCSFSSAHWYFWNTYRPMPARGSNTSASVQRTIATSRSFIFFMASWGSEAQVPEWLASHRRSALYQPAQPQAWGPPT